MLPLSYFVSWLASGERGLSSEAIVSHLTGQPVGRWRHNDDSHPLDPDDFRRCQLLLRDYPLARLSFDRMRSVSPEWDRLVGAWGEIHATIEAESPGYMSSPRGRAPTGYRLMKRILDGGATR